jgi:hypothetical protein
VTANVAMSIFDSVFAHLFIQYKSVHIRVISDACAPVDIVVTVPVDISIRDTLHAEKLDEYINQLYEYSPRGQDHTVYVENTA